MKTLPFSFPMEKMIRVILDTDAYNECDDQYCIAHALMTPKFDLKGILAEHYKKETDSEEKSYQEILRVMDLMGLSGTVPVFHGAKKALENRNPEETEASRFLFEEAMREDPRPLFVCCMGAYTNIATALLLHPEIAGHMQVVVIGGAPYPKGGFEFNLMGDQTAGDIVFSSSVPLWQIPRNVYAMMKVSFFELINRVYPCGAIGKYLVENTFRFTAEFQKKIVNPDGSMNRDLPIAKGLDDYSLATRMGGDLWVLGDSPCVGVLLNGSIGSYHEESPCGILSDGSYDFTREGKRKIRVYDTIDSRFILADMEEKLAFHFGHKEQP